MASVSLDRVSKVYRGERGNVRAVDAVTLEILDREFVVLVGPSGCGKSTTLRMVAGLEEVSEGTIRIADRVVNDVAPKDRDIAMVFQNYALYPHMSVYKNMAFGLKMRRVPRDLIDRKVRHTAGMLGIDHLLDRKPKALSGGERQRVAVGRAIVREPKAFLFDEPLSNLDARLRVTMRAELKRLHRQLQTTTIYVTHDQEEAMTLGDRIAVMRGGLLQQYGPPLEVYHRPANRFVAGFVGTPPMNFLKGRLLQENGAFQVDVGFGKVALAGTPEAIAGGGLPAEVFLGIRPEDMSIGGPLQGQEPANDAGLPMRVRVIEVLGADKDVFLDTPAGDVLVARVPSDVEVGENSDVTVRVESHRVHLFGPEEKRVNVGLNGHGAHRGAR